MEQQYAQHINNVLGEVPRPVNWRTLPPDDLEHELLELNAWVDWLRHEYGQPDQIVPPMWHRHPELLWELSALRQHCHGSNYLAVVYTDRIEELGAAPSTEIVGDSFDNAMAEAVNELFKIELIRRRGPWRAVEQLELATLEYVWWWNNERLHGELDMRALAEVEADYETGLDTPLGTSISQAAR